MTKHTNTNDNKLENKATYMTIHDKTNHHIWQYMTKHTNSMTIHDKTYQHICQYMTNHAKIYDNP